jgi:heavy metal sensor kinase
LTRLGTIRIRLTLWYLFFLALTVLGFSLYLQLELQLNLAAQVDAGLQVAASQLLVNVDVSVDPPTLRPISEAAVNQLMQSSFAMRLVRSSGEIVAEVGQFPPLTTNILTAPGHETITVDGTPWRIYTQQVEAETGQFDAWLQLAQSLTLIDNTQNSLLRVIIFGLPLILIAAAGGGLFIANRALRPVDTITRTVQEINATDLTQRIAYQGSPDELSRLTHTLNSMLERLETSFETERRFTADASHELRTPLTTIKGQLDVTLTRTRTVEEYVETLHRLQRETERLVRLANDLLFLARLDTAPLSWTPEDINLSDLLGAVIDQIRIIADEKNITLQAEIPAAVPITGVMDHLIRLFLNVLDNAVKYTPERGLIVITAQVGKSDVTITVRDNGRGIPAEHLEHLFKRFYRVERGRGSGAEGGSGLGLAIAHQIAREHNGSIAIESTPGEGTACSVRLPLTSQP